MTDFDQTDSGPSDQTDSERTAPTDGGPTAPTPPTGPTGPTPPPSPASPPPGPGPQASYGLTPAEQRNWATGAHLSALVLAFVGGLAVLGPLVVYLIKKDEDTFVAEHSKEALNFQLTWLIGGFVATIVGVIVAIVTLGIALIVLIPAAIGLFIAWIVFTVKAAMAASRGEYHRYPMTVRLVN